MRRWLFEAKCCRLVKNVGEEQLKHKCTPLSHHHLRTPASPCHPPRRYWQLRKAMKEKGLSSSCSIADITSALMGREGEDLPGAGDARDLLPPKSRFQSALAQRIAAANVMWGASDVNDFKVGGGGAVVVWSCVSSVFPSCSPRAT